VIRIALIILATAITSVGATSTYFLAKSSRSEERVLDEKRLQNFFKPLPKRDPSDNQEMRPRW
jgi:hypothetical protein